MTENIDQRALRLWITSGLAIPEVTSLHGDAAYLINNMVAKYTLAADTYGISLAALHEFDCMGIDLHATWPRRKFYGRSTPFKYEHIVPVGIIREALLDSDGSEATVTTILRSSGFVTVLLRTEDKRLNSAGLNARMPSGWNIGDDPTARYRAVGIELSDRVLKVKGAIMR